MPTGHAPRLGRAPSWRCAEIASYVKSLPADLRQVGSAAAKEIGDRFEQLGHDVDAKQDALGGVELPGTFDVHGVIKLLASLFGMTWANIRNRLVKQIGEKAMAAAEKGVAIFQTIAGQGIAGLWPMLLEKLGDIKEMILDKVKDFVVTRVITAGITWLISLLNPAAAFIKACRLIHDVVMFFVSNTARIGRFVNTVIGLVSVEVLHRGSVAEKAERIKSRPVAGY